MIRERPRYAVKIQGPTQHPPLDALMLWMAIGSLKEGGADWLILHRFELTRPPDRVTDVYRNTYQLVRIYRYSDLSGWNWLLYHNLNRPLVPVQALLSQ